MINNDSIEMATDDLRHALQDALVNGGDAFDRQRALECLRACQRLLEEIAPERPA